jgi:hypothetical protein
MNSETEQPAHSDPTDSLLRTRDRATSDSIAHPQRASGTTTFLSQEDTELPVERDEQPLDDGTTLLSQPTWRPLTLRTPYLVFVLVLTIILGSLVLFLTISSIRHNGLGSDTDSSILLFGRRFSPTLLATIYGLFVASVLNDVRRTEIFARLSRPGGASAEKTLCFPTRSWWNDPVDALSKDTRSYALLYASTLYILALLVSPLSAGLLTPTDKQASVSSTFQRAKVGNFSWQQGSEDEIMFRTISGGVIGQSTSVWVSKSSAILPFWPAGYDSAPLGSKFATDLQYEQWQVPSVAYTVELSCQPMSLIARHGGTYNSTGGTSGYYTYMQFGSEDNCVITLADDPESPWMKYGGGWWARPPLYSTSLLQGISNSTSDCGDRTMFFHITPWSSPFALDAHLCSHNFYSSNVLATVSMNQTSTNITFDQAESLRNRQQLDPAVYNISQLQDSFFSSNWSHHFLSLIQTTPMFGGPLASIAAGDEYSNNITKLFASSSLPQEAQELYQQFLGEMLLASLSVEIEKETETVLGQRVVFQRRIVVNVGIGIALAAIMLTSSICVVLIAHQTTLGRRALNLNRDPGTISAATLLLSASEDVRAAFADTDQLSQQGLSHNIGSQNYMLSYGNLILVGQNDNNSREGGISCYHIYLLGSDTIHSTCAKRGYQEFKALCLQRLDRHNAVFVPCGTDGRHHRIVHYVFYNWSTSSPVCLPNEPGHYAEVDHISSLQDLTNSSGAWRETVVWSCGRYAKVASALHIDGEASSTNNEISIGRVCKHATCGGYYKSPQQRSLDAGSCSIRRSCHRIL